MQCLKEKIESSSFRMMKGDRGQTLVCHLHCLNVKSLSVWSGTWNMGECDPPFNLEEWIPNSFDIIAVGVEECMSTRALGHEE